MIIRKYMVAMVAGAIVGAAGIGKLYYVPQQEQLERLILQERQLQKEGKKLLQKKFIDISVPVEEGLLRMYLTSDGNIIFANKLESHEISLEELTQYHLMRKHD